MKPILLFGAPGASDAIEDLTKAQVKGYTRSDGTYVQEHQDSRQAAKPKPAPHIGAHADALRRSSTEDDMDHWTNQVAAKHMEAGDHEALKNHLQNSDTDARDHILDHIHPDHWEKIGFRPLNKQNAVKKYEEKFGGGSSGGTAKGQPKAAPKPKASKKPAKDAGESLGALAEHHGAEGQRHYKLAMEKGADHPDHQHHMKASMLNNQAQYHLEQAKNAENDEDRKMHMGAFEHVKGKLKSSEGTPMKKAVLLFGDGIGDLAKARVKGYTRKDGTYVNEHDNGRIEAHGVKGMKSTPWRKTFKSQKHFEDWLDKNEGNVEVHGTRKVDD